MLRTLPWSLLGHLVALGLLALVGGQVTPPPADARHAIRVRLAGPAAPADARPGATLATPTPAVEPPAPPRPAAGTRRVPQAPKKPPKPQQAGPRQPDAKGRAPDPREVDRKDDLPEGVAGGRAGGTSATPTGGPAGATAGGTDQPFPFAWYLTLVEGQVSRNWSPAQLGFGSQAQRRAVVHFAILSDGTVTDARVTESSGVPVFDREALRAVGAASPLPPLPRGFPSRSLGVSFIFTLRSAP